MSDSDFVVIQSAFLTMVMCNSLAFVCGLKNYVRIKKIIDIGEFFFKFVVHFLFVFTRFSLPLTLFRSIF